MFAALVVSTTATPDGSKGQYSSSEHSRALTTWVTESNIHLFAAQTIISLIYRVIFWRMFNLQVKGSSFSKDVLKDIFSKYLLGEFCHLQSCFEGWKCTWMFFHPLRFWNHKTTKTAHIWTFEFFCGLNCCFFLESEKSSSCHIHLTQFGKRIRHWIDFVSNDHFTTAQQHIINIMFPWFDRVFCPGEEIVNWYD